MPASHSMFDNKLSGGYFAYFPNLPGPPARGLAQLLSGH
jgi:hypothetical protein